MTPEWGWTVAVAALSLASQHQTLQQLLRDIAGIALSPQFCLRRTRRCDSAPVSDVHVATQFAICAYLMTTDWSCLFSVIFLKALFASSYTWGGSFYGATTTAFSTWPKQIVEMHTSPAVERKYCSTDAGENMGSALYGFTAIRIGPMYVCGGNGRDNSREKATHTDASHENVIFPVA